jgi:hypothetical protein
LLIGVDGTCWSNERGYGRFAREVFDFPAADWGGQVGAVANLPPAAALGREVLDILVLAIEQRAGHRLSRKIPAFAVDDETAGAAAKRSDRRRRRPFCRTSSQGLSERKGSRLSSCWSG